MLASETCALDTIGASFIRDVRPGEIIIIDKNGMKSIQCKPARSLHAAYRIHLFCKAGQHHGRHKYIPEGKRQGGYWQRNSLPTRMLLSVCPIGTPAAIGYSLQSGIPMQ